MSFYLSFLPVLAFIFLLFCPCVATCQENCNITFQNTQHLSGDLAFSLHNNNSYYICLAQFPSGKIKLLISSKAITEYPAISPDGQKVIFYSENSGDRELYSINIDGSHLIQLTNSPGLDEDPNWSPDGTKITFSSARLFKKSQNIFIMNANGLNPVLLTNNKSVNSVPKFSPDGELITFSTNDYWPGWDVMVYSLKTNEPQKITSGYETNCRASWNKDGSKLVFSRGGGKSIDLYVADLRKGGSARLTTQAGREYDAIWINDDKNILFSGELKPGANDFQIWSLDLDTKLTTKLSQSSGAIRYLSWHKK